MKFKYSIGSTYVFIPIILILFFLCYHSTIMWMLDRWGGVDSYYSHGYLIPFISGYLVWLKREELKNTPVEYTSAGLVLIIFALLLHILGTILYIFSISGFSILFFIIGAVLFLFGWKITRVVWFPLAFLVFMFPLPLSLLSAITFPLKILVAKAGVAVVNFLGIPVIRNGFDISIPGGNLVVGNPCSGLRSLISFLALGSVLAYFSSSSLFLKVILFFSSIPIAILSNAVRVPVLILISHYYGISAAAPESIWHSGTGMMVFIVGLVLLMGLDRIFQWKN